MSHSQCKRIWGGEIQLIFQRPSMIMVNRMAYTGWAPSQLQGVNACNIFPRQKKICHIYFKMISQEDIIGGSLQIKTYFHLYSQRTYSWMLMVTLRLLILAYAKKIYPMVLLHELSVVRQSIWLQRYVISMIIHYSFQMQSYVLSIFKSRIDFISLLSIT